MVQSTSEKSWRAGVASAASVAVLLAALWVGVAAGTDNPADDVVGTIEGEAIALQGPMTVDVVNGQIKTTLRSGNDIRVKSGSARLDLVEGGTIAICGPAHFSVLKSGGSLTVALDLGVIRVHVEKQPAITIYTAQIQAKPIAIGDGVQDALIGFDAPGTMCVRATSGAIRLEQQLTGQNVIVPQGGDIILNNGALEGLKNTAGHCACDLQLAKNAASSPEVSRLATKEEIQQRDAEAKREPAPSPPATAVTAPKPPPAVAEKPTAMLPPPPAFSEKPAASAEKWPAAKAEPVYQVFMPPLAYDAKAAFPHDDFDPKFIMLVRRVRVRPTLIFQGRVEGDPKLQAVASTKPAQAKTAPPAPSNPANPAKTDSVVNRVRAFLRGLFS
jgi:hypothetical protein